MPCEFECGFGAHKLSHDAAGLPQTRQTPETLKRYEDCRFEAWL
jgi:hypothetical protein